MDLVDMHAYVRARHMCVRARMHTHVHTYVRTHSRREHAACNLHPCTPHPSVGVQRHVCVAVVLQRVAVWVPGDTYMCECAGNIPLACLYAWHHIHSTVNRALCNFSSTHVNTHTPTRARTHTHVYTRINTYTHQPHPLAAAYTHTHSHIHTFSFTNT